MWISKTTCVWGFDTFMALSSGPQPYWDFGRGAFIEASCWQAVSLVDFSQQLNAPVWQLGSPFWGSMLSGVRSARGPQYMRKGSGRCGQFQVKIEIFLGQYNGLSSCRSHLPQRWRRSISLTPSMREKLVKLLPYQHVTGNGGWSMSFSTTRPRWQFSLNSLGSLHYGAEKPARWRQQTFYFSPLLRSSAFAKQKVLERVPVAYQSPLRKSNTFSNCKMRVWVGIAHGKTAIHHGLWPTPTRFPVKVLFFLATKPKGRRKASQSLTMQFGPPWTNWPKDSAKSIQGMTLKRFARTVEGLPLSLAWWGKGWAFPWAWSLLDTSQGRSEFILAMDSCHAWMFIKQCRTLTSDNLSRRQRCKLPVLMLWTESPWRTWSSGTKRASWMTKSLHLQKAWCCQSELQADLFHRSCGILQSRFLGLFGVYGWN